MPRKNFASPEKPKRQPLLLRLKSREELQKNFASQEKQKKLQSARDRELRKKHASPERLKRREDLKKNFAF